MRMIPGKVTIMNMEDERKRDYCKTILLLYQTNVKCENNGLFSSKARKEIAAVDYALADPEDRQLVQHFFWGQIYDLELVESASKAEKAKLDQIYDRILHQMGKARLKEPIITK